MDELWYHNMMAMLERIASAIESAVHGKRIIPVSYGSLSANGTANKVSAVVGSTLMGLSIKENAGATAEFIFHRGEDVNADEIADITLNANESVREWYGPDGINLELGLFVERVSGTAKVTVYVKR